MVTVREGVCVGGAAVLMRCTERDEPECFVGRGAEAGSGGARASWRGQHECGAASVLECRSSGHWGRCGDVSSD